MFDTLCWYVYNEADIVFFCVKYFIVQGYLLNGANKATSHWSLARPLLTGRRGGEAQLGILQQSLLLSGMGLDYVFVNFVI